MAKVAGIKVEKTVKGVPTVVSINLRKHPQFVPLLEEMGIIEKEEEDGVYYGIEEFREILLKRLKDTIDEHNKKFEKQK
jgi:DNA-binding transcriptional ArsR family regulator